MAFVRSKQRDGRTYYYLVESVRDGGQVRQRTIVYLGRYATVDLALAGLPGDIAKWRRYADVARAKAAAARAGLGVPPGVEVPRPTPYGTRGINSLRGAYWEGVRFAAAWERWAGKCQARLDALRAWCSAHDCLPGSTKVGITGDEGDEAQGVTHGR